MAKHDFYQLLGVDRNADEKELKAAYRKRAMEFHPDRNPGDKSAEQKFKEINEAYECLKDPQKRAAYDQFGHGAFEQGSEGFQSHGFSASGFSNIFEDIFGEMMGGGSRRSSTGKERGSDLRYNMEISLEDSFSGKNVQISVPSSIACKQCSGSGAKPGTKPVSCSTCHGHGKIRSSQGFFSIERSCPQCQGNGQVIKEICSKCHGMGRIQQEKSLSINIPPGVEEGTRIRIPNEGETGLRGGAPGDLYIFISIIPHQFFQREGADLHCKVPISMTKAALGGQFEIITLDGTTTRVKVPEGTQGGRQFRLKGKGMPILKKSQFGDLYIQTIVETPQNLSRRQRELLEEFETLSSTENSPQSSGFFTRMKEFFDSLAE